MIPRTPLPEQPGRALLLMGSNRRLLIRPSGAAQLVQF